MGQIKVYATGNGSAAIVTPYSPTFVRRVKAIGGSWNGSAWVVAPENEIYARDLLVELFGTDGTDTDLVDVKVVLPEGLSVDLEPIFLFGKLIASARSRDSGASVDSEVAILEGKADSGGSAKHWSTTLSAPTTLVMHKVPRMAVQRMLNWEDSYGNFIILETNKEIARRHLLEEKERLTARLAEIDTLLEKE